MPERYQQTGPGFGIARISIFNADVTAGTQRPQCKGVGMRPQLECMPSLRAGSLRIPSALHQHDQGVFQVTLDFMFDHADRKQDNLEQQFQALQLPMQHLQPRMKAVVPDQCRGDGNADFYIPQP